MHIASLYDKDIRSPPLLEHTPLHSPLYGGVQREGLVICCLSLSTSCSDTVYQIVTKFLSV